LHSELFHEHVELDSVVSADGTNRSASSGEG
jgi:hypothetical protein